MFDSYKKITVRGQRVASVYFDGLDGEYKNNPILIGAFQVQINNDPLDEAQRGLIATESGSVAVDIVSLNGGAMVELEPEAFYYQAVKLVAGDGGETASIDWVNQHESDVQGSDLSVNFAQGKNGVVYGNDGQETVTEYQVTFFNGYEIITAVKLNTGERVVLPVGANRFEIEASAVPVVLPVRAKDIANNSGELLDTVSIAGTSGAISSRIQNLDAQGRVVQIDSTEDTNTYLPVKEIAVGLASYNNYDLPDGSLFEVIGVSSPFSTTFTGFLAESGRQVTFFATPDLQITFKHEDTNSTAGNRFNLPSSADVVLRDYQTATFIYIDGVNRWYLQSKT